MTLADRIAVMRSGRIEQLGSPLQIYSDPASYFVADFFGSPSMNLVAGEVVRAADTVRFRSLGFDIALPPRFSEVANGRTTLGIRPEHVIARRGGQGDAELPARLVEPLGKDTLLYFDDGTARAFIALSDDPAMAEVKPGARVALTFDPDRLYLFGEDGRRMAGS